MKKLSAKSLKVLRVAHIIAAAVWTGCLACVVFALTGVASPSAEGAYALLSLMLGIDLWLVIPAVGVMGLTAIAYGAASSWGFARHRWVVAKWLLFFAAVVPASVLFVPACESMQTALASLGGAAFLSEGFQADRTLLIAPNVYLVALSAIMIAISACKPWGKTKRVAKKPAARTGSAR